MNHQRHPPQIHDEGERLVPDLHHDAVSYAEHMVRYLFAARLVDGKVVLDAASGVGYGSQLMKAAGARRVIALDNSEEAARYGQYRHASEGLEYIAADAQELPVRDGTIDVVVSFETIEHLPAPERFLQELRRVLRPAGLLIVSTPNRGVFVEGNPFHLHEFTYEELETLLRRSFKNVRTYVQDDWISSAVLTPEEMEKRDEHLAGSVHTYKAMSRAVTQALFMLSICSDGEIPDADEQTVMTGIYEMKGFLQELARKDEQIEKLPELWSALEAKERHIGEFQRMVGEKDTHIANFEKLVAEKGARLEEVEERVSQLSGELAAIKATRPYRLYQQGMRARRWLTRIFAGNRDHGDADPS